ncbi:MAG: hypothetical protein JWN40_352 [Phycisphaerales bacterium]|nr:hypothetical protein [Phycisphaerales bacterium]
MSQRAPRTIAFLTTLLLALTTHAAAPPLLDLKQLDHDRVLKPAAAFLSEKPITVTAQSSPRSAGGPHDFFSEGDYWWPNPADPAGPYIQKDGMTNPDNFVAHRLAMIRLSTHIATLTAAWRITGEQKYADHAFTHLRAWFINKDTMMNPNLQYAQAIKGITTGRGIGVIDTIHLIEVAKSASLLQQAGLLEGNDLDGMKKWFTDYLTWLTTSKNGQEEMNAKNNHGTCWVMQAAAFASFTGDEKTLALCRDRFKKTLLPTQLAPDGSFPLELKRTKPYSYSLFNLDAMATICHICSTKDDNLWTFTTPDGRTMKKAITFITPYIQDKTKWPHKPDVMYHEFWPVRSPALLFAAQAFNDPESIALWKTLEANPTNEEVIRNVPIRQPVLWVD